MDRCRLQQAAAIELARAIIMSPHFDYLGLTDLTPALRQESVAQRASDLVWEIMR